MSKLDCMMTIEMVCDKLKLSESTIFKRQRAGTFPRSIKLGRASRWKESEIAEWIEKLERTGQKTG